jgi:hypothetical protein
MRALAKLCLSLLLLVSAGSVLATPLPKLDIGQGGQCVSDPKDMRLHHMEYIRHQRDETMRLGIRGKRYSLSGCVDCHASKKTGSVLGSSEAFCQGCHQYAAVKPDCFECHSSRPRALEKADAGEKK